MGVGVECEGKGKGAMQKRYFSVGMRAVHGIHSALHPLGVNK